MVQKRIARILERDEGTHILEAAALHTENEKGAKLARNACEFTWIPWVSWPRRSRELCHWACSS